MKRRTVVITGIGTVTPAGRGASALWLHAFSGTSCVRPIDPQKYFDASKYDCQVAGQVPCFDEPRVLTKRILAQTDRCTQIALVAALDALDAAKLPIGFLPVILPERVSIVVGTVTGGLTFVENDMRNFWTKGKQGTHLYLATASFPASAQGYISICFGVKGRARTFVSERASGAHALIEGANNIQRGQADIVIAGGTEAPITPMVWSAYQSGHMLQRTHTMEPAHTYRPFDHKHTGMIIGEGSTFVIFEEREHALRRGVPILAEVRGWSMGTDPTPLTPSEVPKEQPGRWLAKTINASLMQANIQSDDIDVIFPHGSAIAEEDEAELSAITTVFGHDRIPVSIPKVGFGHLQGAAVSTDMAIAVQSLLNQTIPPTPHAELLEVDSGLNLVHTHAQTTEIKHSLILSGGLAGMHACLVVSQSQMVSSNLVKRKGEV